MSAVSQNFVCLTHASIGFFLLHVAYLSSTNLQTVVMSKNGMEEIGFYSLGLTYMAWGIGSIISPAILKTVGTKMCLIAGGLSNTIWILCSILATAKGALEEKDIMDDYSNFFFSKLFICSMILNSAVINGLLSGPMWVAIIKYVSDCANNDNYGFYFSYFWSFYIFSQIAGSIIASIVLASMDAVYFFIIMGSFSLFSSLYFSFLKEPSKIEENSLNISSGSHENYESLIQQRNDSPQDADETTSTRSDSNQIEYMSDIKQVLQLLKNQKMRYLLPQIFWTGISISYYSGLMTITIIATVQGEQESQQYAKAMHAMIMFGVGSLCGTIFIGYVTDKFGTRRAIPINLTFLIGMVIVTLNFIDRYQYSWVAYFMAFLWGLQDGAVATHTYQMVGLEFNNSSHAFAIFSLIQSFSVLVFQIIQSRINTQEKQLVYTSVIGVIGLFACISTYFAGLRDRKFNKD